jgi:SAM-dependent methyltransferase
MEDKLLSIWGGLAIIIAAIIGAFVPWWLNRIKDKRPISTDTEDEKADLFDPIKTDSRPHLLQRTTISHADHTRNENTYPNQFCIAGMPIPYIVLIGGWDEGANEYEFGCLKAERNDYLYTLPKEFEVFEYPNVPRGQEPKCRLHKYDIVITASNTPNHLLFEFSKVEYLDYLKSGEHLNDKIPGHSGESYRDRFAPVHGIDHFSNWKLTNITGVGVFIITRDDKIVISKHSKNVQVYSDVWSYSASGTMSWDSSVNPFQEIIRECHEEIAHKLMTENLVLFGFGIDAEKLYFQFSFFEKTGCLSSEILDRVYTAPDYAAEMVKVEAISFDVDTIVNHIRISNWEPAAAASLLSLCAKRFGRETVERAIDPSRNYSERKEQMKCEWNQRSERNGVYSVMSARYPRERMRDESNKYVQAVMNFFGKDIDDKNALEVGCGNGRITKRLVSRVKSLTCIDISSKMIERNKAYLGCHADNIKYVEVFAQDFQPNCEYDVAILSLIMIHNVEQGMFDRLVDSISNCAKEIFLFEHTDVAYQVSHNTRPRSKEELICAFRTYRVERELDYKLFSDNIAFLKLVRK